MAFIALRKSAVDGLSPKLKRVLNLELDGVGLNPNPPVWTSPTSVKYYVYNDPRITIEDVAYLAALAYSFAKLSNYITTVPEGTPDPFTYIVQVNDAPAALKAFTGVPADWTPVEG